MAVKLIRESNCQCLYLVIPRRWKKSVEINAAIKLRNADVEMLGIYDFENAERQARAEVELIRITVENSAFDAAIESMLPELEGFDKLDDLPQPDDAKRACEVLETGGNLIETLVKAYDAEVASLIDTYRDAVKINQRYWEN